MISSSLDADVIDIDDVTYNHYYRPSGLLSNSSVSNLPEIDINEDEIPF